MEDIILKVCNVLAITAAVFLLGLAIVLYLNKTNVNTPHCTLVQQKDGFYLMKVEGIKK